MRNLTLLFIIISTLLFGCTGAGTLDGDAGGDAVSSSVSSTAIESSSSAATSSVAQQPDDPSSVASSVAASSSSAPVVIVDECDSTQQCRTIYSDFSGAMDCADSASDTSTCLCGTTACKDLPVAGAGTPPATGGNTSSSAPPASGGDLPVSGGGNSVFKHPGILHTADDINDLRSKLNREPWKTAYDKMKSSDLAKLNYTPEPFTEVKCGGFNNPNVGCNQINNDGRAAYTHALLFAVTDDQRHADKARSIIAAWTNKLTDITNTNAPLVAAWAMPFYANAAELLRAYDPKWKKSDSDALIRMFNKQLPKIRSGGQAGNPRITNWDHSKQEALMAIAIFKDDRKEFNDAVDRFKRQLPGYIYLKSDGKAPASWKRGDRRKSWFGAENFESGMTVETCRDLGHMGDLGFASMFYAMQSAWNQGTDLFVHAKPRFLASFKLHGAWMTGDKSVPKNLCDDGKVVARLADKDGIKAPKGGGREIWEIALNHYHTRLGEPVPYVKEMALEARSKGGQGSQRWVRKWETFAFADAQFDSKKTAPQENRPPFVEITNPIDGAEFSVGEDIHLIAEAIDQDTGDSVKSTTLVINGEDKRQERSAPYEWGHAQTPELTELNSLPKGTHVIEVRAEDSFGAKASDKINITIK